MPKQPGDECGLPRCDERIILVNGAAVCWNCDNVRDWPSVKAGKAKIKR